MLKIKLSLFVDCIERSAKWQEQLCLRSPCVKENNAFVAMNYGKPWNSRFQESTKRSFAIIKGRLNEKHQDALEVRLTLLK